MYTKTKKQNTIKNVQHMSFCGLFHIWWDIFFKDTDSTFCVTDTSVHVEFNLNLKILLTKRILRYTIYDIAHIMIDREIKIHTDVNGRLTNQIHTALFNLLNLRIVITYTSSAHSIIINHTQYKWFHII